MQKVNILGVEVSTDDMAQTLVKISELLKSGKQNYFCTPNPEIILAAQKDEEYKMILNNAAVKTADGIGLMWAAEYLESKRTNTGVLKSLLKILTPGKCKGVINQRVTGVELTKELCELSGKQNMSIFLLGAAEGIAKAAAEKLKSQYPKCQIAGTYSGTPLAKDEEKIIELINKSEAEILLVAYGAPAQEKWIARNLSKMPKVKLAGGIGGTFDFIAGSKKRAPKWMQNAGLEWLYRLILEPSRWKRIYNATIKFPLKVIFTK